MINKGFFFVNSKMFFIIDSNEGKFAPRKVITGEDTFFCFTIFTGQKGIFCNALVRSSMMFAVHCVSKVKVTLLRPKVLSLLMSSVCVSVTMTGALYLLKQINKNYMLVNLRRCTEHRLQLAWIKVKITFSHYHIVFALYHLKRLKEFEITLQKCTHY